MTVITGPIRITATIKCSYLRHHIERIHNGFRGIVPTYLYIHFQIYPIHVYAIFFRFFLYPLLLSFRLNFYTSEYNLQITQKRKNCNKKTPFQRTICDNNVNCYFDVSKSMLVCDIELEKLLFIFDFIKKFKQFPFNLNFH